jgi:hypothetical protein
MNNFTTQKIKIKITFAKLTGKMMPTFFLLTWAPPHTLSLMINLRKKKERKKKFLYVF